jgi:16S rRNA G966 N2-methylase RsmD
MKDMTKAKMFDNLIGNIDPNLGNWLLDEEWNIILIDHSRAFTDTKELYHQLIFFDPDLWTKMKALDEASLTTALGNWVDKNGIKAMLQRRDKMEQVINKLKAAGQD